MRTDGAFEFLSFAVALVGFALGMAETGELRPEFLADAIFPASDRAGFGLARSVAPATTEEIDVREALRHNAVNAKFAELVWTVTFIETATAPVLLCACGSGRESRSSNGYSERRYFEHAGCPPIDCTAPAT